MGLRGDGGWAEGEEPGHLGGCGTAGADEVRLRLSSLRKPAHERLSRSVASATNPDVAYRSTIFHGNFLDARSTVVFGVFLGVGTFFFGLIRAAAPKLMLLAIFGTIVVDVMVRRALRLRPPRADLAPRSARTARSSPSTSTRSPRPSLVRDDFYIQLLPSS